MDGNTALRIALSFVLAGGWISLATLAGERLGAKLGGLVTNLPSNLLISLIFIALTRGRDYASTAARAIPVGMAVDTLFLLAFIAALPRGLGFALAASLGVWLVSALAAVAAPELGPVPALILYAAVLVVCFLAAERGLKITSVPKKPAPFRLSVMGIRALFAGTIVAAAVTAAQFSPPYLTAIVSTFPAVLLSTMVILTRSQGPDFARATGKVLILSSSNIIVYASAVGFLFPSLGPGWGTLISFALAAAYVAVLLPLVRRLA